MECPVCHTINDDDAKFCKNCAHDLSITVVEEIEPEAVKTEEKPETEPKKPEPEWEVEDNEYYISQEAYDNFKPKRHASSFLISLAFPAIVLLILLASYLFSLAH